MPQSTAVTLPANVVTIIDGHAVTDSLKIAKIFGRRHDDILRAIRNLLADCPQEFSARNFAGADYIDDQGKPRPMYQISKDGFVLLVMGFTGRQATAFKIAYIAAFNRMEVALLQQSAAVPHLTDPDQADLLARCQAELLRNPVWEKLVRFHGAALTGREQATLLDLGETTVRRHQLRLIRCGLLPNPAAHPLDSAALKARVNALRRLDPCELPESPTSH